MLIVCCYLDGYTLFMGKGVSGRASALEVTPKILGFTTVGVEYSGGAL